MTGLHCVFVGLTARERYCLQVMLILTALQGAKPDRPIFRESSDYEYGRECPNFEQSLILNTAFS